MAQRNEASDGILETLATIQQTQGRLSEAIEALTHQVTQILGQDASVALGKGLLAISSASATDDADKRNEQSQSSIERPSLPDRAETPSSASRASSSRIVLTSVCPVLIPSPTPSDRKQDLSEANRHPTDSA